MRVDVDRAADLDFDAVTGGLDCVPDLGGSQVYQRHVAGVTARRALAELEEALRARAGRGHGRHGDQRDHRRAHDPHPHDGSPPSLRDAWS